MDAGRVSVILFEIRNHSLVNPGIDRHRGYMIGIDHGKLSLPLFG
jgi:hypothetical protein